MIALFQESCRECLLLRFQVRIARHTSSTGCRVCRVNVHTFWCECMCVNVNVCLCDFYARQTRLPGATDNTRYGEGRASPRSFLTNHVANISTAIQTADAQTILNAASARMLRVSFGVL